MSNFKPLLTESQYNGLWEAFNAKRRKDKKTQEVNVEALHNLLMDYGELYEARADFEREEMRRRG